MSEACAGGADGGVRRTAALGPGDWLSLAAAPTFATMALLTGVPGGEPLSVLCGPAHGLSLLGGMAPMYLLMSAFHSPPWLKLIVARRRS
jgi:hypothetical protein